MFLEEPPPREPPGMVRGGVHEAPKEGSKKEPGESQQGSPRSWFYVLPEQKTGAGGGGGA